MFISMCIQKFRCVYVYIYPSMFYLSLSYPQTLFSFSIFLPPSQSIIISGMSSLYIAMYRVFSLSHLSLFFSFSLSLLFFSLFCSDAISLSFPLSIFLSLVFPIVPSSFILCVCHVSISFFYPDITPTHPLYIYIYLCVCFSLSFSLSLSRSLFSPMPCLTISETL